MGRRTPTGDAVKKPKRLIALLAQKPAWNAFAEHGDSWCIVCGCVMGNTSGAYEAHEKWHEAIRLALSKVTP